MPDPARPTVTTGEAAQLLGCSIDTVKNRIKRGDFKEEDAGCHPVSGRWWIYKDLLVSEDTRQLQQENAILRRQLEDVTAAWEDDRTRWAERLASLEAARRADRNRIEAILALNSATLDAGEAYKNAAEASAELVQKSVGAMAQFQTAADKWMAVAATWRDLVAQENVPDDARDLDGI